MRMRTFWIMVAVVLLLFVSYKAWGEDCSNGAAEVVIAADQEFALCWSRNPEDNIIKYKVYKDGQLLAEVLPSNCDASNCWSARMFPSGVGSFVYTVRASNAALDSIDSNSVTVVVVDRPSAPIGCSIITFN